MLDVANASYNINMIN